MTRLPRGVASGAESARYSRHHTAPDNNSPINAPDKQVAPQHYRYLLWNNDGGKLSASETLSFLIRS